MSATASCAEEIRAAISAAGGAIRFDHYMSLALYGRAGFYTSGTGRAGRRGDFLTSPEVGPLFGAVLARVVDTTWDELGRPDRIDVVELGAGPGTLARTVLAAEPRCASALHYTAVEISEAQRAYHPAQVTSVATLPDAPIRGVVVANELLDNLPFRLMVFDGHWREAWVAAERDRFVEVLRPAPDSAAQWLPDTAPLGARCPLIDDACRLVERIARQLLAGRALLIDYAAATTGELAQRPWREWLRTYVGHGRGTHYLRDPGSQDITAEVPLDQMVACVAGGLEVRVTTQGELLQSWGVEELVEDGKRIWQQHAARPTVAALAARSRVSEAEALTDPAGLGSFHAVEMTRHKT